MKERFKVIQAYRAIYDKRWLEYHILDDDEYICTISHISDKLKRKTSKKRLAASIADFLNQEHTNGRL